MHIVFIIENLGIGGPQRLILDIARLLDKKKYKISIIILINETYLIEKESAFEDVDIFTLLNTKSFSYKNIIKASGKMYNILHKLKPDIIHSHLWSITCLTILPAVFRYRKVKWLHTIHTSGGYLNEKGFRNWVYRNSEILTQKISKSTVVIISNAVSDTIKRFGFKKLKFIYNGVDTDRFIPSSNKSLEKCNEIIYVARNQESKGHIYLIKAIRILKQTYPDIKLKLVGSGLKEDFQDLVSSLNLENEIKFTGARNDIPELLSKAKIGVFPSLFEGMPIALCEMMSVGLPVIAFDIPPVREISNDGECIILSEKGNVDLLSYNIQRLLADKALCHDLGEKARKRIVENYSIKQMICNHEKLYWQLMETRLK